MLPVDEREVPAELEEKVFEAKEAHQEEASPERVARGMDPVQVALQQDLRHALTVLFVPRRHLLDRRPRYPRQAIAANDVVLADARDDVQTLDALAALDGRGQ